jgi:hypothetical protein
MKGVLPLLWWIVRWDVGSFLSPGQEKRAYQRQMLAMARKRTRIAASFSRRLAKAVKTIASVGKTQVAPRAYFGLFPKRVEFTSPKLPGSRE